MTKDRKLFEFEGVIFSSKALEELRYLQESDDEKLNAYIYDLSNLVFYLIKHNECLVAEGKNLDMYLELLVLIRETFIHLRSGDATKFILK